MPKNLSPLKIFVCIVLSSSLLTVPISPALADSQATGITVTTPSDEDYLDSPNDSASGSIVGNTIQVVVTFDDYLPQVGIGTKICFSMDQNPLISQLLVSNYGWTFSQLTAQDGCVTLQDSYELSSYDLAGTLNISTVPEGRHTFQATYIDANNVAITSPEFSVTVLRNLSDNVIKVVASRVGNTISYVAIAGIDFRDGEDYFADWTNCSFQVQKKVKKKWVKVNSTSSYTSYDGPGSESYYVLEGSINASSTTQLKAIFPACKIKNSVEITKKKRMWVCRGGYYGYACSWQKVRYGTGRYKNKVSKLKAISGSIRSV